MCLFFMSFFIYLLNYELQMTNRKNEENKAKYMKKYKSKKFKNPFLKYAWLFHTFTFLFSLSAKSFGDTIFLPLCVSRILEPLMLFIIIQEFLTTGLIGNYLFSKLVFSSFFDSSIMTTFFLEGNLLIEEPTFNWN